MTRDSKLWPALMILGAVCTALAALTNPGEFGIPTWLAPYLKLAALILGVVTGTGAGIAYQHTNLPSVAEKQAGKIPGGYVLLLALLAVVLCPSLAFAQGPITQSAYRISREYQATQVIPPPIVNGEPTQTALYIADAVFVMANITDFATTYVALGQTDVNGQPINQEGNPVLPNSRMGIAVVKGGAIVGGLIAAHKLWPDKDCKEGCGTRKWAAIGAQLGASLISFSAACNNVYQILKPGIYPAPAPTMPVGLRFTLHP